jgi:drug/metabolite transporter (DMT)-like permease
MVLALSPIFSIFFAAVFLREYPSRKEIFFCLFPILGVLLMAVTGMQLGIVNPMGILCLAGVCLSASAIRITNRGAAMEFSAYERTYAMLFSCSLYFTFRALLEAGFDLHIYAAPLKEPVFLGSVLGLVLLCSIGSNMLGNYAAGRLTVARYTALSSISTLFSLFSGIIFLHEPMTPASFCGAVMILTGLIGMSQTRVKTRGKPLNSKREDRMKLHNHPMHLPQRK